MNDHKKQSDYSVFRPHLEHHRKLGEKIENNIDLEEELETKELAERLDKESEMEESFIRSIISDGRDYFVNNYDIVVEARREGSGGNATIFWRRQK